MGEIKKMLIELRTSDVYINLMNYYSSTSIFNIIGKARSETVHSNFITWILRPEESHGLGEYPLQQFLLLLARAKSIEQNTKAFLPENFEQSFLIGSFDIHEARISREYPTGQIFEKKKGYIDILIEVDLSINGERKVLPIIIENKVFSVENTYMLENNKYMQTVLYHMWGEDAYSSTDDYYRPLYVFFTPNRTKAANNNYINISYQDFVDIVLEPSLMKKPSEEGKLYIKNYLRCLSYSEISNEEEKKEKKEKKGYVMAFTDEEKKLLRKFYETNKPLLSAVALCLQDDDDLSEEDKNALETFTQVVNRDYTKYNFNGQTKLGKGKLVLVIVKKYIEDKSSVDYEELHKVFPDEYQGSFGVIKEKDKIDSNNEKRYYSKSDEIIRLSVGTEIVVCNQWGTGNVDNVIKKAEELGYIIEKA